MLVQTQRISATLLVATVLVGCSESGFESHFVFSDRTESLMKEARNGIDEEGTHFPGVKELVTERFGTPQDLHAWMKLPIEFGGVTGKISVAPDATAAVKELSLELDGELDLSEGELLEIQFLTGPGRLQTVQVENWSVETGIASLSAPLETTPAAGDAVIVNGGGVLKHGRGLYMRHCSHCHGTSGDGAGPIG